MVKWDNICEFPFGNSKLLPNIRMKDKSHFHTVITQVILGTKILVLKFCFLSDTFLPFKDKNFPPHNSANIMFLWEKSSLRTFLFLLNWISCKRICSSFSKICCLLVSLIQIFKCNPFMYTSMWTMSADGKKNSKTCWCICVRLANYYNKLPKFWWLHIIKRIFSLL